MLVLDINIHFFESLWDCVTIGVDYEYNHKTLKKIFFDHFLEFFDIVSP